MKTSNVSVHHRGRPDGNRFSCYGNKICRTPNIDRLAARARGSRGPFVRRPTAGRRGRRCCRAITRMRPVCWATPARVLPSVTRATWPQHFKNAGYYTARVSKIFHMGVPGGIEEGGDGADDPASWTERFNSPGPEWQAPGIGRDAGREPRWQEARHGRQHVRGGRSRWR
jgi:iduronate 2-sulfatase